MVGGEWPTLRSLRKGEVPTWTSVDREAARRRRKGEITAVRTVNDGACKTIFFHRLLVPRCLFPRTNCTGSECSIPGSRLIFYMIQWSDARYRRGSEGVLPALVGHAPLPCRHVCRTGNVEPAAHPPNSAKCQEPVAARVHRIVYSCFQPPTLSFISNPWIKRRYRSRSRSGLVSTAAASG